MPPLGSRVIVGPTACVTVILRTGVPVGVENTVIVPVLGPGVSLPVALILNEPFPIRLTGLKLSTVNHCTLLTAFHGPLDVTLIVEVLAADVGFHELADTVSVAGGGCWVTVTVRIGESGAVTVIVPVLATIPVLVVTLILNEPSPVRFVGLKLLTVSQSALLLTVHVLVDATPMVVKPAANVGFHVLLDSTSAAGGAACVTAMVLVGASGAVTVTVAVLAAVVVLTVAFSLNEPLPVRLNGLKLSAVSHAALVLTVHVLLDDTDIKVLFAPDVGFHTLPDNMRVPNAVCVTSIVRVGANGAVTVTVAVLTAVVVLAVAFSLNEPLPVRLAGTMLLTVSHTAVLLTVHVVLDVTLIVALPAEGDWFHDDEDSVRVPTGAWVTNIVRVGASGAVTVILPVLENVFALAFAVILNEPLPVRLAGTILSTDSQKVSLLTVHVVLDVTLTFVKPATGAGSHVFADNVRIPCGACVTINVRVGASGAVTVIVPVLVPVLVLAVAFNLNEPLPVRLTGLNEPAVSQFTLLLTVHVRLDVTLTVALLATDVGLHVASDNVRAPTPGCVTTIVRVGAPGAVTVIVPVLVVRPVLAVAFILNEPSPLRNTGLKLLTVSQDVLLLTTLHVLLDVTFIVALLAADVGFQEFNDSASVGGGAACVTAIVRVGAPGTVTVTVADLEVVPVLAVAFNLNQPSPVRLAGVMLLTVSHAALLLTFHVPLDVTLIDTLLAIDVGVHDADDNASVGVGACVTVTVRVGAPRAVTVTLPVL